MDQLYTVHDALELHIGFRPSFKNNLLRRAPIAKISCCVTKNVLVGKRFGEQRPLPLLPGPANEFEEAASRRNTALTPILGTRMHPGLRRNQQILAQRTAQKCLLLQKRVRPMVRGRRPRSSHSPEQSKTCLLAHCQETDVRSPSTPIPTPVHGGASLDRDIREHRT